MKDYIETVSLDAFLLKVQTIFLLGISSSLLCNDSKKEVDDTRLKVKIQVDFSCFGGLIPISQILLHVG